MSRSFYGPCIIALYLFGVPKASGSVVAYDSTLDASAKSKWQTDAGAYSTCNLADLGLPSGKWLDEQYAYLGVHFTDGSDQLLQIDGFLMDGWGLNGAFDDSTLKFDTPMTTIAADFPGTLYINLYSQGQLIYASPLLGTSGLGHFAGLISTVPFDKVVLHDGGLFVDNIYFGPPVPAPAALALFGIAALAPSRRRR